MEVRETPKIVNAVAASHSIARKKPFNQGQPISFVLTIFPDVLLGKGGSDGPARDLTVLPRFDSKALFLAESLLRLLGGSSSPSPTSESLVL